MTLLVVLSVVLIALLIAGLAFYLFWVGSLLAGIATNLEAGSGIVGEIVDHAKLIGPGVEHINRTGGVVAGALPLLYGMAEGIVTGATYAPDTTERPPARPASGTRRSRLHEAVGFTRHS
jgi:hypothetical protein